MGSNAYEFQSPRVMAILNTFNIWDPGSYMGGTMEEPLDLRKHPFEEGLMQEKAHKIIQNLIKAKGIRNKGQ